MRQHLVQPCPDQRVGPQQPHGGQEATDDRALQRLHLAIASTSRNSRHGPPLIASVTSAAGSTTDGATSPGPPYRRVRMIRHLPSTTTTCEAGSLTAVSGGCRTTSCVVSSMPPYSLTSLTYIARHCPTARAKL